MRLPKLFSGLLLAAAAAVGGCYGHATYSSDGNVSGVAVFEAPPAPRVVVNPAPRPGFVYIQGRWYRNGAQWNWRDGYWVRERVGYSYNPGRWQHRNNGYIWVDGRWSARNGRGGRHYR